MARQGVHGALDVTAGARDSRWEDSLVGSLGPALQVVHRHTARPP
jgi:hypothetical protein